MFRLASSLADLLTVSSSLAAGRLVPDSTLRRLGPEAGGSTTFCTYEMRCSWSGRRRLRDCDAASGCDATTAGPAQITNTAFTVKCQDNKSGTQSTKYLTTNTHTHTRFNGPFSGTTRVSWYQKGTTNLDFTEARDSEWQWHQLGHMQVCTSLQTDNHTSTQPLMFLQAGCPSCHPTNSVKALKEYLTTILP